MHLILKKSFQKQLEKLTNKLKDKVLVALLNYRKNPNDPTLRKHKLKGKLIGLESLDVTPDLRLIIRVLDPDNTEIIDIGSHSRLY